jgi:catechol 2,3-dioxygenase-like lactoylglutathione lyase family enzyme
MALSKLISPQLFLGTLLLAGGLAFFTEKETAVIKQRTMKMNAGFITAKLAETKQFYTEVLAFTIKFENGWFLLLESPGGTGQVSFLEPGHPSQQKIFQESFTGKGAYLTIETDDADELYSKLRAKGIKIEAELRDEPWGDRHFAITDPNGIGIDIVKYIAPD